MKKTLAILCAFLFVSACTEEYDLQLKGEEKLVVEMEITNAPPPYYIQLTKSKSYYGTPIGYDEYERFWWEKGEYDMVYDALVIVSDDSGIIDTLNLSPDSVWVWVEYDQEYHFEKSNYPGVNGYYQTSKIKGAQGHTYYLRIEWNNKVYTAECTMPESINIDTVTMYCESDKYKDGAEDGNIPYLWFHDNPRTENFYLFSYEIYAGKTWGITTMSDENIKSDNICGIDAFSGVSPDGFSRNSVPFGLTHTNKEGGFGSVRLYSVTKEVYDYYNSLINQIRFDGGVYTPSPASAPTNIKGGALGLFNAASVDWRYFSYY